MKTWNFYIITGACREEPHMPKLSNNSFLATFLISNLGLAVRWLKIHWINTPFHFYWEKRSRTRQLRSLSTSSIFAEIRTKFKFKMSGWNWKAKKCWVKNKKGTKKTTEYIIHFTSSIAAKYFQGEIMLLFFSILLFFFCQVKGHGGSQSCHLYSELPLLNVPVLLWMCSISAIPK